MKLVTRLMFCLRLSLCLPFCSFAQEVGKAVGVGERLESYSFRDVMNYKGRGSLNVADFKGKVLILDFWNTGCSSCVASWPKLISLQDRFADSVQVVLVNPRQSRQVVGSLISKRERLLHFKMNMPVVCNDREIEKIFPHTTVPHVVWIDPSGRMRAVTGSGEVNERNLERAIRHSEFPSRGKDVFSTVGNYRKPLFQDENVSDNSKVVWSSVISEFVQGLYPSFRVYSDSTVSSVTATNMSVLDMLRYLYAGEQLSNGLPAEWAHSRIRYVGRDSIKYAVYVEGEVQYDRLFSYQLIARRRVSSGQLKRLMISDVERYFGVRSYIKKATVDCLVLTALDESKFKYSGGEGRFFCDGATLEVNDKTFDELVQYLVGATNYYYLSFPIVNETGYKGKIGGIRIEANVYDPLSLSIAFRKYGIGLSTEKREIELLVVESRQSTFGNGDL
jgi:thiol-disulfide isomerase/thioredoxin